MTGGQAPEPRQSTAEEMTFSVTPYGVQAHIPIFRHNSHVYADLYWCSIDSRDARSSPSQEWYFLRLMDDPTPLWPSACHPSYMVDEDHKVEKFSSFARLQSDSGTITAVALFSWSMKEILRVPLTWETVLIRHKPTPSLLPGEFRWDNPVQSILRAPFQFSFSSPFRFDEASAQKFVEEFGAYDVKVDHTTPSKSSDSYSHQTTAYTFACPWFMRMFAIKIGQCHQRTASTTGDSGGAVHTTAPVWATLHMKGVCADQSLKKEHQRWGNTLLSDVQHSCLKDHVLEWPKRYIEGSQYSKMEGGDSVEPSEDSEMEQHEVVELDTSVQDHTQALPRFQDQDYDLTNDHVQETFQKTFRIEPAGKATLSFTRCPINPQGTLILKASWVEFKVRRTYVKYNSLTSPDLV